MQEVLSQKDLLLCHYSDQQERLGLMTLSLQKPECNNVIVIKWQSGQLLACKTKGWWVCSAETMSLAFQMQNRTKLGIIYKEIPKLVLDYIGVDLNVKLLLYHPIGRRAISGVAKPWFLFKVAAVNSFIIHKSITVCSSPTSQWATFFTSKECLSFSGKVFATHDGQRNFHPFLALANHLLKNDN